MAMPSRPVFSLVILEIERATKMKLCHAAGTRALFEAASILTVLPNEFAGEVHEGQKDVVTLVCFPICFGRHIGLLRIQLHSNSVRSRTFRERLLPENRHF